MQPHNGHIACSVCILKAKLLKRISAYLFHVTHSTEFVLNEEDYIIFIFLVLWVNSIMRELFLISVSFFSYRFFIELSVWWVHLLLLIRLVSCATQIRSSTVVNRIRILLEAFLFLHYLVHYEVLITPYLIPRYQCSLLLISLSYRNLISWRARTLHISVHISFSLSTRPIISISLVFQIIYFLKLTLHIFQVLIHLVQLIELVLIAHRQSHIRVISIV